MGNFVSIYAVFKNQSNGNIPTVNGQYYMTNNTRINGDIDFNSNSIFDGDLAQPYFGDHYEETSHPEYHSYAEYIGVYNNQSPFNIKAGNNFIIGKGAQLHALSEKWTQDLSLEDFKSCWKISQNVIKTAPTHPETQTTYDFGGSIIPAETKSFSTTLSSVTFNVVSGAASLLQSSDFSASNFSYSTNYTETTGISDASITVSSISWASIMGNPNSNTITFNNLSISGTIHNPNPMPVTYNLKITLDAPTYNASVTVTAKAQIYDYALDAYDFANIYGGARFYYLYYGNEDNATSKTNCLSFTSSRFEDPYHPNQEVSSGALVSSDRKPSDTQLAPYKPKGDSYELSFWETQFPYVYDGDFTQDAHVQIRIKNVIPKWINPSSVGLTLRSVIRNDLYYTDSALANNSFLENPNGVLTSTLWIPADASSVSRTFYYYGGNTGRLIKAVYTGAVIDTFRLNGSLMTTADKSSLQNRYLQVLINSSYTTMPSATITGSLTSFSRKPLPVAVKFDFESSTPKVEVYFYVKFNSSSSGGDVTWRIISDYNLYLVTRTRKAGTISNLGQDGKLLKDNRYYSFTRPKGYSKSGSSSVAFDALFDASLDKVSFVDRLPDGTGNYSLDPWNKAYPSNYSFVYEKEGFSPQKYRMGIIDSNFIPNFNWTPRGLSPNGIEMTSGSWKPIYSNTYGTTYKLGLITTISNGEISYTLKVAAKDLSGTYNTYQVDYSISSPLILLKISAAGGNGGYSTYGSPYKGGGGGGSGAAAWVLLDLTYTNWTDNASRESNIYIFLGTKNRRTETEIKNKALSSFISFEEPVYNSSSTDVSIPSRDYIKLGPGNDGKQYEDENRQNFGGTGGTCSRYGEVDGSGNWCSYCYILQSCNGANGGRGENNSDKTGGHSANPGNPFNQTCYSVRNRYSKTYESSIFTDVVDFDGGGIHVHSDVTPEKTFSPGGGGAASIFNSAKTVVGNKPTATSPVGAGGTGGCYYNYDDGTPWGGTAVDLPSWGGVAYADIYCLLKSN